MRALAPMLSEARDQRLADRGVREIGVPGRRSGIAIPDRAAAFWRSPMMAPTAGDPMAEVHPAVRATASLEQRVDAIQAALDARGFEASQAVDELGHLAQEEWLPRNGARVVARAWTDPAFRQRLLDNGRAAVMELGLSMPK